MKIKKKFQENVIKRYLSLHHTPHIHACRAHLLPIVCPRCTALTCLSKPLDNVPRLLPTFLPVRHSRATPDKALRPPPPPFNLVHRARYTSVCYLSTLSLCARVLICLGVNPPTLGCTRDRLVVAVDPLPLPRAPLSLSPLPE